MLTCTSFFHPCVKFSSKKPWPQRKLQPMKKAHFIANHIASSPLNSWPIHSFTIFQNRCLSYQVVRPTKYGSNIWGWAQANGPGSGPESQLSDLIQLPATENKGKYNNTYMQ